MKEIDVADVINMNYRVLTLLGMVTAIVMDCKDSLPHSERYKCDWFMQAVTEVVYRNQPIPPMPERELL